MTNSAAPFPPTLIPLSSFSTPKPPRSHQPAESGKPLWVGRAVLGGFSPALELHLGPVTGSGDGGAWRWQSCDCGHQADGKGESYGWTCQAGACVGGWGGVDSGCHPRSFRTQRAPVGVGVCVCGGGRNDTERVRHRGKGEAEGRETT